MGAILSLTEAEPTTDPCATPGCREDGGEGLWGVFCGGCASNLARIRAEYDEEQANRCVSFRNGKKTHQRPPVCCTVGCDEPRKHGETYCVVCRAMGATEDEAA